MKIQFINGTYSMDSINFAFDGVQFLITGTKILENNVCVVDVKNLNNGKTKEYEHKQLCRIILDAQSREALGYEVINPKDIPKEYDGQLF